MQASQTTLREIIQGDKQYIVPLFQRPYSWKKSQWEALWNDILELCNTENPRPHFMGSIVTMPVSGLPEGVSKYLLIDGQQRLTTIFILFSALRDQAKDTNKQLAEELHNKFLINQYQQDPDIYKLQPTQVDRKSFYSLINQEEYNNNQSIKQCYVFFQKKIRQINLDFGKIKQVISSYLSIVSVVLSTEDNPYLVFESLNAKGEPLTQADLIRNYFFLRINTEHQDDAYNKYWLPMQQTLDVNLTEFIRHYLTRDGVEIKKDEVYFQIKERMIKRDAIDYLQDLYKFSEYYAKLLDPLKENNLKIRCYLERINRLEQATVYPFLLNCYHDYEENKLSEADFISVLQILENFIIRRFVCNVQTRGLNRIFSVLYSQVSKESNLAHANFVERLKLDLQNRDYPKDAEFQKSLFDVKLYGAGRSKKGKLILESIEESFNHKEQVSFDELEIEHIMPQTITKWWQEHLGEYWGITHDLFLHSLGNLTLTGYNSESSNGDFNQKKEILINSHLEINKYFKNQETWKREDIERRSLDLAKIVLQIWPYFGNENLINPPKTKIRGTTPKQLKIFGKEYTVKSWRDVVETTLNVIADLEPDKFEDIIQQFPRFISRNETDFRRDTRKLENGVFVNVNLSARDINAFCIKAIETAELSTEEWEVETTS
ncbi:DUF262 domain-containing HNH endonuclease family protein [Dolichospermum sp. ST_con]|nr:DUF262 domain-containing HNH endonuclease family protein [Dolichospermum sp. ST_con]MDD1421277.1 DUF262 domain-containing HNH endonuclease family protein [Dolichospermum sp. ST_sed1]MDD1426722.1 DUF262 domain-containing HNH endonuclease family protein [Dolichospermum sp. ST_sed9]MDD1431918.1 DUF262 domain-containing HNH endonuclease family protein [Dolichospermum sp. ST_sed6]MDD1435834.1 DUF262 domain-containing HNH endonuclease family protein [Dolichospermum sp. ST_sed10]MDD1441372.1 DUF26